MTFRFFELHLLTVRRTDIARPALGGKLIHGITEMLRWRVLPDVDGRVVAASPLPSGPLPAARHSGCHGQLVRVSFAFSATTWCFAWCQALPLAPLPSPPPPPSHLPLSIISGVCLPPLSSSYSHSPALQPPHDAIRLANLWRHFRSMRVTWLAGFIIFPSLCIISVHISDTTSPWLLAFRLGRIGRERVVIDHFYVMSACNFAIWIELGATFTLGTYLPVSYNIVLEVSLNKFVTRF